MLQKNFIIIVIISKFNYTL